MGLYRRSETRAVTSNGLWNATGPDGTVAPYHYDGVTALELAAVKGCSRIRAGLFAQMPMQSFRLDAQGRPIEVARPLIDNPSFQSVPAVWKSQMSISRDIWGNAFGLVTAFDNQGFPSGAEWLPPWRITTYQPITAGPIQYFLDGKQLDPSLLIVVPSMYVMPGSPLGQAPLQASGLVDVAKKAQEFGRDWFTNGAFPSTIITVDDPDLTPDDADEMRDRVTRSWRRRKPAVVGSGITVESNKINAEESQFLATMRHVQVDICMAMGVPPEAFGISSAGNTLTYQNREDAMQSMLVLGFNGDLAVVQDTLSSFIPRGNFVRLNTGALLRTDLETRYKAYAIGLDPAAPFITVDEVRGWENLGPAVFPPAPVETVAVNDRP